MQIRFAIILLTFRKELQWTINCRMVKAMARTRIGWQTGVGERAAYMMYFAGQLLFNTIVASFTLTYLLNLGISEVVAGGILLLPKIWDAVNDTMFGFVVDKVRFKRGQFLPWVLLSALLLPVVTVLFFSVPENLSVTAQCAWVVVGYVLWDTAYTMTDTPIYALSTSMTSNVDERTTLLSLTRITSGIGGMLPAIAIPLMYGENGMNMGWSKSVLILSVIGAILMLPAGLVIKERHNGEKEKDYSIKELFNGLIQNKNLLVIILVKFISLLTFTLDVLAPICAQYVLGNEQIGSLLTMAVSLPILVLACFMPMLCKKFDKVYVYAASMGLFVVASLIAYPIGYANFGAFIAITVVRGIGYGGLSILAFMFIPDCVEYGEYKTGMRNSGSAFALQTFIFKLNSALISSTSAWIIALLGFHATAVTEAGRNGVWFVYTVYSAIGCIIAIPLLLKKYTLRDNDVKLMAQFNNGEITREECEAKLSERNRAK